jgi:hypothetical protein
MAHKKHDRLKQALLLVFVGASLVLVGLIWVDGLVAEAEQVPSYYRGAPGTGAERTVAPEATLAPAATATPAAPLLTPTPLPPEEMPDEPLILPGLDDEDS